MKIDIHNTAVSYTASWQTCISCNQEEIPCVILSGLPHGPHAYDATRSDKQLAEDSAVCLGCLQSILTYFQKSERAFHG